MHTTRELLIKTDVVPLSGAELNTGVSLSPRGKEVLELFMNGYTYQQTASQLGISVSCVRRHCERMLWKNNCKSMLELIAKYHTPLQAAKKFCPDYNLGRDS